MVLNGESATIQIDKDLAYIDIDGEEKNISKGLILDILPTLQNDDKEVLLKGHIQFSDVLENRPQEHNGKQYDIPYVQVANIPVHAVAKSGGTIFIQGPELTVIKEIKEPTPVTTRPSTYQPRVTHKQRILILIKSTVLKQQEASEPAIGVLRRR